MSEGDRATFERFFAGWTPKEYVHARLGDGLEKTTVTDDHVQAQLTEGDPPLEDVIRACERWALAEERRLYAAWFDSLTPQEQQEEREKRATLHRVYSYILSLGRRRKARLEAERAEIDDDGAEGGTRP